MDADEFRRSRLTRAAISEHDQQLLAVVCQTYRQLEQSYHQSAAYRAMVNRYPELERSIALCSRSDLIGGPQYRITGEERQAI